MTRPMLYILLSCASYLCYPKYLQQFSNQEKSVILIKVIVCCIWLPINGIMSPLHVG